MSQPGSHVCQRVLVQVMSAMSATLVHSWSIESFCLIVFVHGILTNAQLAIDGMKALERPL